MGVRVPSCAECWKVTGGDCGQHGPMVSQAHQVSEPSQLDLYRENQVLRERIFQLETERDEALRGLEKLGWPCRLSELPAFYGNLARNYSQLEGALRWALKYLEKFVSVREDGSAWTRGVNRVELAGYAIGRERARAALAQGGEK